MTGNNKALGRGLGALLPDKKIAFPSSGGNDSGARRELRVDQIRPNPEQPRRVFESTELSTLADSLSSHGVIQPVLVRKLEAPLGTVTHELIVGERRWRAAQMAGLERIPVTVSDLAPKEVLEVALVENVQRQDLNPLELGLAFRALIDSGASQQEVGLRIGLDRSTVSNHLRLLELPSNFQEDLEQGRLTMGHAKALLQVVNPERRLLLRDKILQEGLSVRAAEELARRLGSPMSPTRRKSVEEVDTNLKSLVSQLRDRLQTKVKVSGKSTRGRIEIEFYGESELTRLVEAILERS